MESPKPIQNHPNATLAGVSGAITTLVIWGIGLSGTETPPEVAAAVATIIATLSLAIGRKGILGFWEIIMRGDHGN
jgi:hypothetical protein